MTHQTFGISRRTAALIVIAVSLAVYASTLWGEFVYDDVQEIVENAWIRDFRNIPDMFTSNAWSFHEKIQESNYYRPMMHVFHMSAYYLFGVKPWGHHLLNVVLNAVASLAVFLIFFELFDGRAENGEGGLSGSAAALAGALIFTLHPAHTEVVAWASAMAELEASSFGLFGLYLYIRSEGIRDIRYGASVLLLLLAVLTKETAIMYFPLVAVYDHCVKGRLWPARYAAYGAAIVLYFALRWNALGGFAPKGHSWGLTPYEQAINALPLFAGYFWKLVWPANLNALHVFHPVHSLAETKSVVGALLLAACGAGVCFSRGVIRFSILWAGLPLLPVLYLPGMVSAAFAERYLFLASAGFALAAAVSAAWIAERRLFGERTAAFLAVAVLAISAVYAAAVIERNRTWNNSIALWEDTVKKSPDAGMAHYNLGNAYLRAGRLDEAVAQYHESMRFSAATPVLNNNLGVAYSKLGQMEDATAQFESAVRLKPEDVNMRYNLAKAYEVMGRKEDARREFLEIERLKGEKM